MLRKTDSYGKDTLPIRNMWREQIACVRIEIVFSDYTKLSKRSTTRMHFLTGFIWHVHRYNPVSTRKPTGFITSGHNLRNIRNASGRFRKLKIYLVRELRRENRKGPTFVLRREKRRVVSTKAKETTQDVNCILVTSKSSKCGNVGCIETDDRKCEPESERGRVKDVFQKVSKALCERENVF